MSFPHHARLHTAAAETIALIGEADLGFAPDDKLAMTIRLTDDEEVAALNKQFRGVDAPTDVLSFPADEIPLPDNADEPIYLGDLVIALPYALAQAAQLAHPPADSVALLVVHGTLHLLGFDHDTPENRAEMWQAQAAVLESLGIAQDLVPALEANGHGDEVE